MKAIGIRTVLFLCLAASTTSGDEIYLLSHEWTLSPFDGSDPYRRQVTSRPLWVSSEREKTSIPSCSGRYACELYISEAEGSKGRLAIEITEYDSPDTPSKIVTEIDTTVGFVLGKPGEFETRTASALVRLDFLVMPGAEGATKASVLEETYGIGGSPIIAVHYYTSGEFVGARLLRWYSSQQLIESGFRLDDIVVGFNQYRAEDESFVDRLQASLRNGQANSLLILRDGNLIELQID